MQMSDSTPPAATMEQDDLVDALIRSAFATMAVLSKVAADNDLSLTQLRVLAILRDRRLRMTELAGYLGLEKSTMSGLVDRAEKRGLLERGHDSKDGRAVEVFLSADGSQFAERVAAQVTRSLAPLTQALSSTDRGRLSALLERTL